jgi:predicted enzyme related to lactoylglutathione lyase
LFKKLDCACIYTSDINASLAFYQSVGLTVGWQIDRTTDAGEPWTLIGLKFSDAASSELVLSNSPEVQETELEIHVDDVRSAYETLKSNPKIKWIREPFAIENGHVAVMTAPDGNDFVLIGG